MDHESADLHREVIKLLLQVAWADDELAAVEREHIRSLADNAEFSADEKRSLEGAMKDRALLPAPDYDLLRKYKQDVKRAVVVLIRKDRHVAPAEAAILERIEKMLEGN